MHIDLMNGIFMTNTTWPDLSPVSLGSPPSAESNNQEKCLMSDHIVINGDSW